MPAVEIEVLAAPSVNQAMAHNGLAFLHRLVIQVIDTDDAVPDATVQIHLLDSDGTLVSRPFERDLHTLEPAVPVVLDAPKVALNPQYLAQIDEEIAAEIIVTVSSGAMTLGQSHTPIRILAARQWLLEDRAPVRSLELLASFVQPNHPAVTPIVAETAQLLERRTRSGSLAVQHAEPSRIDAVVEAAFDTIRDRYIFYANPPAS